ncbi:MAG TPA: BON domain-containing protein [Burkholderiales bacterium]|nr:BON domain-containing protein [Burkholderiales bacterium]
MKTIFAIPLIFTLVACGDSAPPPKPAAPAAPPPQAEAPKAPETKAPEAPKPDPNKELAQRVKQALEGDGKVQAAAVDVTAASGRVTLWGTAATAAERTRAGQIAAKVDGVSAVDNQLKVVKGS